MKSFVQVELAQINRVVVVVVDSGAEDAEFFAKALRSLDPQRAEFWRIEGGVANSCDEVVFSAPTVRSIQRHLRAYVGAEKTKAVARKFLAEIRQS